jgi:hypothetical protein
MLRGLGGNDIFVFLNVFGQDTIVDFVDGVETLDFRGSTQVHVFSDLTVSSSGSDAVVSDGLGNQITGLGQSGNIELSILPSSIRISPESQDLDKWNYFGITRKEILSENLCRKYSASETSLLMR